MPAKVPSRTRTRSPLSNGDLDLLDDLLGAAPAACCFRSIRLDFAALASACGACVTGGADEIADARGLAEQVEDAVVELDLDHQVAGDTSCARDHALAVAQLGDLLDRDDDLAEELFEPLDLDAAFDGLLDRFLAAALDLDDVPVLVVRDGGFRRRVRIGSSAASTASASAASGSAVVVGGRRFVRFVLRLRQRPARPERRQRSSSDDGIGVGASDSPLGSCLWEIMAVSLDGSPVAFLVSWSVVGSAFDVRPQHADRTAAQDLAPSNVDDEQEHRHQDDRCQHDDRVLDQAACASATRPCSSRASVAIRKSANIGTLTMR